VAKREDLGISGVTGRENPSDSSEDKPFKPSNEGHEPTTITIAWEA
jgi:hypothetical protein